MSKEEVYEYWKKTHSKKYNRLMSLAGLPLLGIVVLIFVLEHVFQPYNPEAAVVFLCVVMLYVLWGMPKIGERIAGKEPKYIEE